jgi:translation initiation factor 3 subunit B
MDTNTGFGNVVVVDNLPIVPPEKFAKLEGVIAKIFGQIGVIREHGLWMPREDGDGKSKGYAFIEYTSPQEAQTAREQTNGYKLDKAHVFNVNMFDDFDKYMKVPDTWVSPETKPYTPGVIFDAFLARRFATCFLFRSLSS